MADVQPFRAVRYTGAAGALADLVAPPYDAISEVELERLHARSPHNVVHLTLPDSAEHAGRLYRSWLSDGMLERDGDPAAWLLVEQYTGPDGVSRERRGVVVSLAPEPYESGRILPHERTNQHTIEERLELLRETRVHPEPIFLLVDRPLGVELPEAPPDVTVGGARLWRLEDLHLAELVGDAQLLIADGHHRYECAVAFASESAGTRLMALVVSTGDPGLHVFPTHRVFKGRPDLRDAREGEPVASLEDALALLDGESATRSATVAYRADGVELVRGGEDELDVELVDRYGVEGITYTPHTDEAVSAVDTGAADVAFLLREPRVEDVFAFALRGERMPRKSTYFFPKPLSGLLFHPVDS